jgi:hypothetical protein
MSRLIFVPQYPSKLRYQEFFYTEFPKQLSKYFDEVITLGTNFIDLVKNDSELDKDYGLFTSREFSINLEFDQVNDYLALDLKPDDVLLLMDISYPGFFSNVLYHKPIKNCYAYCHATSLNKGDIFEQVRYSKFPCETAHSKLFKKVFVGSNYHKNKLKWKNIKVIGLPVPPFETIKSEKKYDIISVCRPNKQKITKTIENNVERDFGPIVRQNFDSWEQYYKFLSEGKVLLITSKEDTFNYTIMEAIMNGTVVLAPYRCSYPELLDIDYLYFSYDDLRMKLWNAICDQITPPKELQNQELVDNFYINLIKEIKES